MSINSVIVTYKNQIGYIQFGCIMQREDRRKQLAETISKNRKIFNQFRFSDLTPLQDDDILLIKQIGFPQTEIINYQNNNLTAVAVKILCQAYPNAQEIEISQNNIQDQATLYIAKLTQLSRLKLRRIRLSKMSMKNFVGVEMKNLMEVHLNQNHIGNKGCKWLTQAKWPYLKSIFLTNCGIDDGGALHLSKATWISFTYLYLMENMITQCGVSYLKKANWSYLKTFNIKNDGFRWWFRMKDFYPHRFHRDCNFSFKRLKRQRMMMSVSSRYNGYIPFD